MSVRGFVIAACMLVYVAGTHAQSGAAREDPVTGRWSGELTLTDPPKPVPVQFQLKVDGNGVVSGTFTGLARPGDVKKGTYNAKARSLRLELGIVDESTARLVLEGTIDKGVARGKVSGEKSGEFRIEKVN